MSVTATDDGVGFGVRGQSSNGTGVVGTSTGGPGVMGNVVPGGPFAVEGVAAPPPPLTGVFGHSYVDNTAGVVGQSDGYGGKGVEGISRHGRGVVGTSTGGPGVVGTSTAAPGVMGTVAPAPSGPFAVEGVAAPLPPLTGVFGHSAVSGGNGVTGTTAGSTGFLAGRDRFFNGAVGVYGESVQNGVFGRTASSVELDNAVYGQNDGAGHGVCGVSNTGIGVFGTSASGLAAKFDGDVEVTGDIRLTNLGDCAEEFDVLGAQALGPGTVMVINEDGVLQQCDRAYDTRVAGVVSGAGDDRPGIVLGKRETQSAKLPIALVGKVYCKVDARFSPIEVGDLLTTSSSPGHAMKAKRPARALGALIGKALRPLAEGTGLIPILVALQ